MMDYDYDDLPDHGFSGMGHMQFTELPLKAIYTV